MGIPGSAAILILLIAASCSGSDRLPVELPPPETAGTMSLEEALSSRRSVRSFADSSLELAEAGQLLWAAQGVTSGRFRTAPSAGALYPFTIYLVAGDVDSLAAGVYRYAPVRHRLDPVLAGDVRPALEEACLGQPWIGSAPALLVLAADFRITQSVYARRGEIYVHMEAGHISQNIYLQCQSLGLGTVAVGAFEPQTVGGILELPDAQEALYVMPVGAL